MGIESERRHKDGFWIFVIIARLMPIYCVAKFWRPGDQRTLGETKGTGKKEKKDFEARFSRENAC